MNTPKFFSAGKLILKQLLKWTDYFISRPYYWLRTSETVWKLVLNHEGRKLYKQQPPFLNGTQKNLAAQLRQNGIAITSLEQLFPGSNHLAVLQKYAQGLLSSAQVRTGKKYMLNLWEVSPLLELDNPFVSLALDESILVIVNTYLEMYSKFYLFTLNLTVPVGGTAPLAQSQRWHRDPEDKKMCKVFIYLNDVDEETGPFIYIPQSHYGGKRREVFPQRPPKGIYPPAGAVEKIVPPQEIKICLGKAGTVIFCDTSGLHKGGYALAKERLMFTAGYFTQASLWPRQYRYPHDFKNRLEKFNSVCRYALNK